MAYYSDGLIDDILSTLDIVQVINEYVPLKRRGVNYIGLCPFHKEKTPSFTVSSEKQIYKCFGCSEGGTLIQFVSKIENIDFRETLEFLADKAHIDTKKYEVNTLKSNFISESKDKKDIVFDINKNAANYFYEALEEEIKKEKSILKDYLKKRNLDISAIRRFGIGFGTKKNETLLENLSKKGYKLEDIFEAGLLSKTINGKIYEPFSFRLIFPIFDTRDRVIGFGGRVLDNSLPKYVNSPENIVYHKGRNLFALNIAKRQKLEQILLVEGYMDALSLHKSGVDFAVASLGTALTENQSHLLKKYTDTVILGYDQDGAGQAAILRAIDILRKDDLKIKVLKLDKKETKDPDEYINKCGKDRFLACVKNSISAVEFKIEKAYEEVDLNIFDQKVKFLTKVATAISEITNSIERDMYVEIIAKKYNVSKDAILEEVNKKIKKIDTTNVQNEDYAVNNIKRKSEGSIDIKRRQEQYIIAMLLLKDKKIVNKIVESFKDSDFENDDLKELYRCLKELNEKEDITKINVASKIDKQHIKLLTEIMCIDISSFNKIKLIEDLKRQVKINGYQRRREEILNLLKDNNISEDEKSMLKIEMTQIIIKLKK